MYRLALLLCASLMLSAQDVPPEPFGALDVRWVGQADSVRGCRVRLDLHERVAEFRARIHIDCLPQVNGDPHISSSASLSGKRRDAFPGVFIRFHADKNSSRRCAVSGLNLVTGRAGAYNQRLLVGIEWKDGCGEGKAMLLRVPR